MAGCGRLATLPACFAVRGAFEPRLGSVISVRPTWIDRVTLVPVLPHPFEPRPRKGESLLRRLRRWGVMGVGAVLVVLGILIAPLPGPLGVPVSLLGLVLILRNSYWAKRQFIRAQHARPKWVYPFRRLMRKKPEFAPVFWQQALRAEKLVVKRPRRRLARLRKGLRRYARKLFR